jgi:hypothetical protein
MITRRGLMWGIFGAATTLLIIALVDISTTIAALCTYNGSFENRRQSLLAKEMQTIDNALKNTSQARPFNFNGEFESPLRLQGAAGADEKPEHPKVSAPLRPRLIFKGILMKESPLAIVEDETGKTYICKVGEEVMGQKIVKIQATNLTLGDAKGTYSLSAPAE